MKTYTFAIQKGGTGKTSVSVSVAVELAKIGRTILIDADPQGNTTDWMNLPSLQYELSDVLSDKCTIKDVIQPTQVENLFIIPTAGIDGGLRTYQETVAQKEQFKLAQLKNELANVFDYCVIDTSPAFGALEESCFIASDEVINVLKLDRFSDDGLKTFKVNLDAMKKRYDNCYGVSVNGKPFLNKLILNENNNAIAQCRDLVAQYKALEPSGYKVFVIPTDTGFRKAQTTSVPVQAIAGAKKDTLESLEEIAQALK